ncbi:hypothetical protein D1646_05145 [Pseudoflavonifractor sp. 60]|uniref:hypothetical protein n=1 Tax=Pseudoflavonifractor sp. 60 TaxID=2304576 RepID=UPI001367BE29|nr:hypothetical protein [Pseudoflavonifractor sp. 60]NBI66208.1 hypothetical protein [Pseudoflavonifractor sp. 60]
MDEELAEQLEAVRNGTAKAARLEDGGLPMVTFSDAEALENAKNLSIQEIEDGVSISIQWGSGPSAQIMWRGLTFCGSRDMLSSTKQLGGGKMRKTTC